MCVLKFELSELCKEVQIRNNPRDNEAFPEVKKDLMDADREEAVAAAIAKTREELKAELAKVHAEHAAELEARYEAACAAMAANHEEADIEIRKLQAALKEAGYDLNSDGVVSADEFHRVTVLKHEKRNDCNSNDDSDNEMAIMIATQNDVEVEAGRSPLLEIRRNRSPGRSPSQGDPNPNPNPPHQVSLTLLRAA